MTDHPPSAAVVIGDRDRMPAGPLFSPLKQEAPESVSAVPEPVVASILAAGAVVIFRRSRTTR